MAIWQCGFSLVPKKAVELHDGLSAAIITAFGPLDEAGLDEAAELPNYWEGRSPQAYESEIAALLTPAKSWSEDALMFGDHKTDDIQLWTDGFYVRLDMRAFQRALAQAVVSIAARDELMLIMSETGRLIPPVYARLEQQIGQSRAVKFVGDPIGTLNLIARLDSDREI